ncbi:MAG: DUF445 family protein [Bacillota bacterium]
MNHVFWLTPLIGGLIGWFTNYLAVKMIFRPQKPITIPVLGFTFQGLIPKRKSEIAKTLGEIIERELISWDELAGQIVDGETGEHLVLLLAAQAKDAIVTSLPALIPEAFKSVVGGLVENTIVKMAPGLLKQFANKSIAELKEHLSLSSLIEEKISRMEWDELEGLVFEVAARELKHIEMLGGVIGFLIGLIQLLIGYFFG